MLESNGDKNEICKYCDSLTLNQIGTFTASMHKFSGGGIIGARKYSFSSMVIFTLQYTQGHYYFLSDFSSGIQSLLKKILWTTSVALN